MEGCTRVEVGVIQPVYWRGEKFSERYMNGGLAQLARAPALHAGGQRFESVILHQFLTEEKLIERFFLKMM